MNPTATKEGEREEEGRIRGKSLRIFPVSMRSSRLFDCLRRHKPLGIPWPLLPDRWFGGIMPKGASF